MAAPRHAVCLQDARECGYTIEPLPVCERSASIDNRQRVGVALYTRDKACSQIKHQPPSSSPVHRFGLDQPPAALLLPALSMIGS